MLREIPMWVEGKWGTPNCFVQHRCCYSFGMCFEYGVIALGKQGVEFDKQVAGVHVNTWRAFVWSTMVRPMFFSGFIESRKKVHIYIYTYIYIPTMNKDGNGIS